MIVRGWAQGDPRRMEAKLAGKVDFYACMAKAFLDDKDAGPDKIGRYFEYVVG